MPRRFLAVVACLVGVALLIPAVRRRGAHRGRGRADGWPVDGLWLFGDGFGLST
jgi:hypothetical protein